jgi:hypothetical protein
LPNDPITFTALPDERIVGVSLQGRLVQSTLDHRMYSVTTLPTYESHGEAITALGMASDRKLYFALAHNMRLGNWDPEDGEIAERFIASPMLGEVSALGFAGERLLIGCADSCAVMAYYPDLPYRLMENPRLLGVAGDTPRRPIGPMVHHESNVYFAAAAVIPTAPGAIIRCNPLENELMAFTEIIPGQNLTTLVADRLSGFLVAGGAVNASSSSPSAAIAFWSPYQEQTVRIIHPIADCPHLYVWAAEGGRIYCTDGAATLIVLSSQGDLLTQETFPLGEITSLITDQSGELFGLAGGWFFHLEAEANTIERIIAANGSRLTAVRRGLFAFTDAGTLYTVRVW